MTTEQYRLLGKFIGVIVTMTLDLTVSYLMGVHFHAFIVGLTTYFILGGMSGLKYEIDKIKEKL